MTHREQPAGIEHRPNHLATLGFGGRDGLLEQDVVSLCGEGEYRADVLTVLRRHHDGVGHAAGGGQLLPARVGPIGLDQPAVMVTRFSHRHHPRLKRVGGGPAGVRLPATSGAHHNEGDRALDGGHRITLPSNGTMLTFG